MSLRHAFDMQSIQTQQCRRQSCARRAWPLLSMLCFVAGSQLAAAEIRVSSISELQAAIDNASPGDKIVVVDGVYRCEDSISIATAGTKTDPIEISAATVGGVEIRGANGFK